MNSLSLDINVLYENTNYDKKNEIKKELANIFLKSRLQTSILLADDKPKVYDLVKSTKPISKTMFPMITRIIKTGSRAEQVYLEEKDGDVKSSDVDYIYEVGPAVVTESDVTESDEETFVNFKCYKWKATNNVGFYNIQDKNGAFVNPVLMQLKVAPMIERAKIMAELPKPGPSLPKTRLKNKRPDDEDEVISLKCLEWPTKVWKDFESRKSKFFFSNIMDELREENLYLVPKSHPKSEDPWIEWRLSFSMIEIKIMDSLPYIFRKVLLLCKSLSKKIVKDDQDIWVNGRKNDGKKMIPGTNYQEQVKQRENYLNKNKITSYILKTVFLWKCEQWHESGKLYTEDDLFKMVTQVFVDIKKRCVDDKMIPQYFSPTMNLVDFFKEDDVKRITSPSYLKRLTEAESLIDIIIGKEFNHLYSLIKIGPFYQKNEKGLRQYYETRAQEVSKTERFVYLMASSKNSENNQNIVVNKVDLVIEIYCMFLYILKNMQNTEVEVAIKYERYVLYALKTFSASFKLEFNSLFKYCESLSNNVTRMIQQKEVFKFGIQITPEEIDNQFEEKFFWECDIEFRALTSKINLHLNENKAASMEKIADFPFFKDLVHHVSKMLNLRLQDPGFSLPTPGVYLADISTKLNKITTC